MNSIVEESTTLAAVAYAASGNFCGWSFGTGRSISIPAFPRRCTKPCC
jgi:hypothetical protein